MNLFVYGTLQAAELMTAVVGGGAFRAQPAVLHGYRVAQKADDVVPLIAPASDGVTTGLVVAGLCANQRARLDLYEAAFGYQLFDVTVTLADGADQAVKVYLPPNDVRVDSVHGTWSLAEWRTGHLAPALYAVAELFAHDPLPDPATLRQMWPMMEKRAWSRHRAVMQQSPPATLRYAPQPSDMMIKPSAAPIGDFFRMQPVLVHQRQFDGTVSDRLSREVFLGIEAVLVLPYDPVSDRLLLVEQARMGPAVRGDRNPWTLEPVAGMIDARETALQAAHRETYEEAGLSGLDLHHIASFYPSPGSSTDYFHSYLGLGTLPDRDTYTGGLAAEHEDLRLHTVTFDAAMALTQTGEITAGPLYMMIYWLAMHRSELRTKAA